MPEQEKYTPSYIKIQNYVMERINNGEYPEGYKIPSEVELADLFSVSRITANKAIKELSVQGILERTRGKGTFVCPPKSFSTDSQAFVSALNIGLISQRIHKLLQFRIVRCPEYLAQKSWFVKPDSFYEVILANMKKDARESLDFTYVPCSIISDVTSLLDQLSTHYVFEYLKTLPQVHPKYLKIFFMTPSSVIVDTALELLNFDGEIQSWCTNVYDKNLNLLCSTITVSTTPAQETPIFIFEL